MPRLDTALVEKPKPAIPKYEKKEIFDECKLSVSINKQALTELEIPPRSEHVREVLLSLPEKLNFKPGINLIFGENGSGKTTIAKAIKYAITAESRYRDDIARGRTQEEAEAYRKSVFEVPSNRGTDFEEFLQDGITPMIASVMKVDQYENNGSIFYCDIQKEVGCQAQKLADSAGRQGYNLVGNFVEISGFANSDEYLQEYSSESQSSRQTVDTFIRHYLEAVFSPNSFRFETEETDSYDCDWGIPEVFKKESPLEARISSKYDYTDSSIRARKNNFLPGIAFIDEPESGMDVSRHISLPEHIDTWYPEGSIMIVPTNSTELYRSNHTRLDLATPGRGIYTPT